MFILCSEGKKGGIKLFLADDNFHLAGKYLLGDIVVRVFIIPCVHWRVRREMLGKQ